MKEPIGTVIIVCDNKTHKILLGLRKNAYKSGNYGLPGGRVDGDERLNDCAMRELLEETSITARDLKYLGAVKEWQGERNFIHFVFKCESWNGKAGVVEPDKCESWKWFDKNNLPKNILPGHKKAIDLWMEKINLVDF